MVGSAFIERTLSRPRHDFLPIHALRRYISFSNRSPVRSRTSFYRSSLLFPLFVSFFWMTSLWRATPRVTLAPNVTLVAHTRQCLKERWKKKLYVYNVSSTESKLPSMLANKSVRKRLHIYARLFVVTKESTTSIRIALSRSTYFWFNLTNYYDWLSFFSPWCE